MKVRARILGCLILTSAAVLTGCSDNADKKLTDIQKASVTQKERGNARIDIDFSKDPFPAEISDARGFSGSEPWGRWTDGERAVLTFNNPLPKHFDLVILVHGAFGPNANKPVKLKIGETEQIFVISIPDQTITLPVSLSGDAKSLEILLPAATSPKSIGASEDIRRLGIAISKISITPKSY